ILALAAVVAVGGGIAGVFSTAPLLLVTSPLLAAGLAAAAAFAPRPVRGLAPPPQNPAPAPLCGLLPRAPGIPDVTQVQPLVSAACDAAQQLYVLEVHLAAFHAQEGQLLESTARWREAYERCRRGKELLVQRMQEASAALSRWQAARGAGENLGMLARELSDESRHQHDAAQEVEALLA